jgi:hypothetical protein
MVVRGVSIQIMSKYISSALELAITSARRVELMSIQLRQQNRPNLNSAVAIWSYGRENLYIGRHGECAIKTPG